VSHVHDASTLASKYQTDCGYRELLELAAIFDQDSWFFGPPGIAVKGLLSEVRLQSNDSYKSRNTLTGGLPFDSTAS